MGSIWDPFHERFFRHNSNSTEISFRSHPSYSEMITMKFCTGHCSYAVMPWAKFCSDMNGVTLKPIFHQIWINLNGKIVCEMGLWLMQQGRKERRGNEKWLHSSTWSQHTKLCNYQYGEPMKFKQYIGLLILLCTFQGDSFDYINQPITHPGKLHFKITTFSRICRFRGMSKNISVSGHGHEPSFQKILEVIQWVEQWNELN